MRIERAHRVIGMPERSPSICQIRRKQPRKLSPRRVLPFVASRGNALNRDQLLLGGFEGRLHESFHIHSVCNISANGTSVALAGSSYSGRTRRDHIAMLKRARKPRPLVWNCCVATVQQLGDEKRRKPPFRDITFSAHQ